MFDALEINWRKEMQKSNYALRKEGKVPGVLFGEGKPSSPIWIERKKLQKILSTNHRILELLLDGKKTLANIDEVQRDHLGQEILHVTFHALNQNKKSAFQVPLKLINSSESKGVEKGGVIHLLQSHVTLVGLPKDIPDCIEIDATNIDIDAHWKVSDLSIPKALTLKSQEATWDLLTCSYAAIEAEPAEGKPVDETPEQKMEADTQESHKTSDKVAA